MFKEFLLKHRIIITISVVILAIIVLMYAISNTSGSKRKKIIKAITYSGFTLDSESDNLLYEKDIDSKTYEQYKAGMQNGGVNTYKHLYFDPNSYKLIENYFECDEGAEAVLTATYDYKHDKLSYNYVVKLEELDLIYSGKLDSKGFTCKTDYTLNAGTSNKDDFCLEIEKKVREFETIRLETITSTKILNYMKEK